MTTLLVASGGGHLRQLVELAPRLEGVDPDFVWVTWDAPQSRSMLAGRRVVFVRPTPPRSPVAVASNLDYALRLWVRGHASALVTTGSQLVLPFLVVGRMLGRPCHFIESAARSHRPSLTARLATRIPGMQMYSQYPTSRVSDWRYVGSVFDGFRATPRTLQTEPSKFVVTLGTMPRWQFQRLIKVCISLIPPGSNVVWQTGATKVDDLEIDWRESLPADELERATIDADVVISHAGVGSALTALRCGKLPILVAREASLHEHVDNHQHEIAAELGGRGLALVRTPDTLTREDFSRAANTTVDVPRALEPITLPPARATSTSRWRSGGR